MFALARLLASGLEIVAHGFRLENVGRIRMPTLSVTFQPGRYEGKCPQHGGGA